MEKKKIKKSDGGGGSFIDFFLLYAVGTFDQNKVFDPLDDLFAQGFAAR